MLQEIRDRAEEREEELSGSAVQIEIGGAMIGDVAAAFCVADQCA